MNDWVQDREQVEEEGIQDKEEEEHEPEEQ